MKTPAMQTTKCINCGGKKEPADTLCKSCTSTLGRAPADYQEYVKQAAAFMAALMPHDQNSS